MNLLLLLLAPLLSLTSPILADAPPYGTIFGPDCAQPLQTTHDLLAPLANDLINSICTECPSGLTYSLLQRPASPTFTWATQQLKAVGFDVRESWVPDKLHRMVRFYCVDPKPPGRSLCEDGAAELKRCVSDLAYGFFDERNPIREPRELVMRKCGGLPAAAVKMLPAIRFEWGAFLDRECRVEEREEQRVLV